MNDKEKLEKIARKAHNLADSTCEENGIYTVTKDEFDELCEALDEWEYELEDNYTL